VAVGDLEVRPFTVPHDAREPVQYLFSDGAFRVGLLTDIGMPTPHVIELLSGCDGLVLECNHDARMLRDSDYPRWLRERIAGPLGHLENGAAAELLAALDRSRLKHLVAAHLSERNNQPELACAALAAAMNCTPDWIGVARQDEGFAWREVR
jgi:phosphoribosyl 1,2-cyclic phosphodiesterase